MHRDTIFKGQTFVHIEHTKLDFENNELDGWLRWFQVNFLTQKRLGELFPPIFSLFANHSPAEM